MLGFPIWLIEIAPDTISDTGLPARDPAVIGSGRHPVVGRRRREAGLNRSAALRSTDLIAQTIPAPPPGTS